MTQPALAELEDWLEKHAVVVAAGMRRPELVLILSPVLSSDSIDSVAVVAKPECLKEKSAAS